MRMPSELDRTVVGTLFALCFVGVACSPANETNNVEVLESTDQALTLSQVVSLSVNNTSAVLKVASSVAGLAKLSQLPKQDCSFFDAYTAALGTSTVDCLGTIGPDSFGIDEKGYLRRRFEKCVDGSQELLATIDGLLSLQVREHQTKNKRGAVLDPVGCMAGRYQGWAESFRRTGITECPVWKKTRVVTEANKESVARVTELLPKLLPYPSGTRVERDREPPVAKQDYAYQVSFASGRQDKACQDPASCAAACVGGFPGALVKYSGEEVVLDPTYWLEPTITTIYTAGGYYHGMSYYGEPPGDLFGHYNRRTEACSFYDWDYDVHYLGRLKPVQVGGVFASWMTQCAP